MKKFFSTVLSLICICGLVACSSVKQPNKQNDLNQTSVAEKKQEPNSANDKMTELTFWHSMDGAYAEVLNRQVKTFNEGIGKKNNIHVTAVFQEWPGTNALTMAMSSDDIANMPDIIQLYAENVSLIRNYKRTVWAEDMFAKYSELTKKQDLLANTISSYSIKGRMIGVPYNISALLMYYNEDLFDKAGIKEVPKNLADLAQAMKELKDKTNVKHALNVQVSQFELENWIATQGKKGTFFGNNDSGHAGPLNKFAAAENGSLTSLLKAWQNIVSTDAYKPQNDSIKEEFANKDSAIVIMTSSRIPAMKKLIGDKFKWNVAPIPTVNADDKQGAFPSGAGLYIINRDDKNKVKAAWIFNQFMISNEAQSMWLEKTGYVPVNQKVLESEAYKKALTDNPQIAVAFNTLKNTGENVVSAFVPAQNIVNKIIKETMLKFGKHEISMDEAQTQLASGVQKAFDEYYKLNPES